MKKFNEAAALHLAAGALKAQDVPVGIHDLSRVRVILTFPEGASVQRADGSEGEGLEAEGPGETASAAAALLFIKRSGLLGPTTFGLWKSCILEAEDRKLKAKELTPIEAVTALRQIHEALPSDQKPTKKTSANRLGVAGVDIFVERLPIKVHDAGSTASRKPARDVAAAG